MSKYLDGPPIKLRPTVTEERPKSNPDLKAGRRDVPSIVVNGLSRLRSMAASNCSCALDSTLQQPVARSRLRDRLFAKPNARVDACDAGQRKATWPTDCALGTKTQILQPIEREYRQSTARVA